MKQPFNDFKFFCSVQLSSNFTTDLAVKRESLNSNSILRIYKQYMMVIFT